MFMSGILPLRLSLSGADGIWKCGKEDNLEKGKYRICKSFSHEGKELALHAEFEIK